MRASSFLQPILYVPEKMCYSEQKITFGRNSGFQPLAVHSNHVRNFFFLTYQWPHLPPEVLIPFIWVSEQAFIFLQTSLVILRCIQG